MQDIGVLLKSLHELEFLFAYHKHILTITQCHCDSFVNNLKEFYRVYMNMKNLSVLLRKGILKIYTENCKLKQQNTALNHDRTYRQSTHMNKAPNLNSCNDLSKQFFKLDKHNSLMNVNSARDEPSKSNKSLSQQELKQTSQTDSFNDDSVYSEFTVVTNPNSKPNLIRQTSVNKIGLLKSTPKTMTIAQAFEDTEVVKRQVPSFHEHTTSSSSFSSSGYYSQMNRIPPQVVCPPNVQHRVAVVKPNFVASSSSSTSSSSFVASHSLMRTYRQESNVTRKCKLFQSYDNLTQTKPTTRFSIKQNTFSLKVLEKAA